MTLNLILLVLACNIVIFYRPLAFSLQEIGIMSEIEKITNTLIDFRDDRDWKQFHNPKDLALALSIEAAELNELFLWKQSQEADLEKVKDELADVFTYAFFLAENLNLDVSKIIEAKLAKSALKYPVDKAKGTMRKYDEL